MITMRIFRKRAWIKSQGLTLRRNDDTYFIYYHFHNLKCGVRVDIKDEKHIRGVVKIIQSIKKLTLFSSLDIKTNKDILDEWKNNRC